MARPRKKPEYDRETFIQKKADEVVAAYGDVFDDRFSQDKDHKSIRKLSKEFNISIMKTRKILVTAGVYSTETSRTIQKLYEQGFSIPEIMAKTSLSKSSVCSYLPYSKVIYRMENASVDADRKRMQRKRECLCTEFVKRMHRSTKKVEDDLWKLLKELEPCVVYTKNGQRFHYKISGNELFIDRKKGNIAQENVFLAFQKAKQLGGNVSGPRQLRVCGASYIYPIFVKVGIINKEE
ncbi:MAG: hypothetical protein IKN45_12975 [Lachnospiraceae bacterium]|nr:hypothetical protein [Lachnospiraceae bacterium]